MGHLIVLIIKYTPTIISEAIPSATDSYGPLMIQVDIQIAIRMVIKVSSQVQITFFLYRRMINIKNDPTAEPNKMGNPPPSSGDALIVESMVIISKRKYKNHVRAVWLLSFFVLITPTTRGPKALIVSQKIVQPIGDIFKIVSI